MKHEPKVHLIGDRPICPVTIENLQSRGGHVYHTELTNTGKLRLLALPVLCLYYTAVRLLPPGALQEGLSAGLALQETDAVLKPLSYSCLWRTGSFFA